MRPRIRVPAVAALISASTLLAACAPAIHSPAGEGAPAPVSSSCQDPIYLRLRSAEPDSLSEREWARLQQLEEMCVMERSTEGKTTSSQQPAARHGAGLRDARWLWMPATMLFGGLMWLMLDG